MAKKGALCNSLFISRRTSSVSTDISSFCIKRLKYFGEPLGSCKSLSKTVSYLARSSMIGKKLPPLQVLHWIPKKGTLHFANINVTFTSLCKTFCQKFAFSSKDSCNTSSRCGSKDSPSLMNKDGPSLLRQYIRGFRPISS